MAVCTGSNEYVSFAVIVKSKLNTGELR
jgi:hypothetical protein